MRLVKIKRSQVILLSVIVFLVAVRMVLPFAIRTTMNKFLADFSPELSAHIDNVSLSFIRGAYRFEGISAKLKKDQRNFLKVGSVDVSIAWREMLKGRLLTDMEIEGVEFHYNKDLIAAAKRIKKETGKNKEEAKSDMRKAKEKMFPFELERVDISNTSVILDEYPGLAEGKKLEVTNIEGRITNLTPTDKFPISFYNIKATLFGSSVVKVTGHVNMKADPVQWDAASELQGFDLTAANGFLKHKVPLTFTKGHLDVYAEAKSEHGKVDGYVKPFFRDLDVIKSHEHFKNAKQVGIEMVTALANLILRAPDKLKTVATKIPFVYDHKLKIDTGKAVKEVIDNGFKQQLSPGLENKYEIK